MDRAASFDDFDWTGNTDSTPSAPAPAEAPPPPRPETRRRSEPEDLPAPYGRKNVYKRPKRTAVSAGSFDDYDWDGSGPAGPRTGGPAYNPDDDWAITRGFKSSEQGSGRSIKAAAELARIATLSPEDARKAMIEFGNTPVDPSEVQLQVPGFSDIRSVGQAFTWLGESAGSMAGSVVGAAEYGGLPGAALGAGVGAGLGALGAGAGAAPGAVAGAGTGFTTGMIAAYEGMGVGGMFEDLMRDEGVKKGLTDGSIDTGQLLTLTTGAGLLIGALDAVPGMKSVKRLGGKDVAIGAAKTTIKKAIIAGAKRGAKEEGLTEFIQGAISEATQAYEGGNIELGNRIMSSIDQGLAGMVGGGTMGGAGGYRENQNLPAPAPGPAPVPPAPGPVPPAPGPVPPAPGPGPTPAPPAPGPVPPAPGPVPPVPPTPTPVLPTTPGAAPPPLPGKVTPAPGPGAAPALPAGTPVPANPVTPPVVTGGLTSVSAAPPVGASKSSAPGTPVNVIPKGGTDAAATAALNATSPQAPTPSTPAVAATPGQAGTTGNLGVDAALAGVSPAAQQPTVPTPQVPQAPAAPDPNLFRTDSTYQPGGEPAMTSTATEGLPSDQFELATQPRPVEQLATAPQAAPPVPDASLQPAPALAPAPAPAPVETPQQQVSPGLTPEPEPVANPKAERAKQREQKREADKLAKQQAKENSDAELAKQRDRGIVEYSRALKVESPADVAEAKETLDHFRDQPDIYRKYHAAMSVQLRRELGPEWDPETPYSPAGPAVEAPQRGKRGPRKGTKPYGPPKDRTPRKRDVRKAVDLEGFKRPKPKGKAKVKSKKVAVTKEVFENIVAKHGAEEAHKRLVGATVSKGDEAVGTVEATARQEKKSLTSAKQGKKPKPMKVGGTTYEFRSIDSEIEKLAHRVRILMRERQSPAKLRERAKNRGLTFERARQTVTEIIERTQTELDAVRAMRNSDLYKQWERYETYKPLAVQAARTRLEEIEAESKAEPGHAVTITGRAEPLTVDELLRDYKVEHETEETSVPEGADLHAPTAEEYRLQRLREHFANPRALPVRLASAGFNSEERQALKARGMASDKGIMDAGDFALFDASAAGIKEPPPAQIEATPAKRSGKPQPLAKVKSVKPPKTIKPWERRRDTLKLIARDTGERIITREETKVAETKPVGSVYADDMLVRHGSVPVVVRSARKEPAKGIAFKRGARSRHVGKINPVSTLRTMVDVGIRPALAAAGLAEDMHRVMSVDEMLAKVVDSAAVLNATERALQPINKMAVSKSLTPDEVASQENYVKVIKQIVEDYWIHGKTRLQIYEAKMAAQDKNQLLSKIWNKQEDLKNERLGKIDQTKSADAVRGEAKNTLRNQARKQLTKAKGQRDEIRWKMNEHFDTLGIFHQQVKSAGLIGEAARDKVAEANAAIDKLKLDLIARAEKEDAVRVQKELDAIASEVADDQFQQFLIQAELKDFLMKQVDAGTIDQDMANMLGDFENAEYAGKFRKRLERQEITGPALRAAVDQTTVETIPDDKLPRYLPKGAKVAVPAGRLTLSERKDLERLQERAADPKRKRKRVTEEQKNDFLMGLSEKPGAIPKLPDWLLQQTRDTVVSYLTNAKKQLDKMAKRRKKNAPTMPTQVNPNLNSVEENVWVFVRQKLHYTGKPTSVRGVEAEFEKFDTSERVIGQAAPKFNANKVAKAETEYTAKERELGGDVRFGASRNVAGRKEAAYSDAPADVRQKTHRVSNLHDAMQVMIYFKAWTEAQRFMKEAQKKGNKEDMAAAALEASKSKHAMYGVIFDTAAMNKFAQEQREPGTTDAEVREASPTATKISDAVGEMLSGRVDEGTRESHEEQEAEEQEAVAAANLETARNKWLNDRMRNARLLESNFRTTLDKRKKFDYPLTIYANGKATTTEPVASTTVRTAAKDFIKDAGWLQKAIVRSVSRLIPDMPVHFVDGDAIDNKAGRFVSSGSMILLNKQLIGSPKALANVLIHEMVHGATAYALDKNLHGTRDILESMMREFKQQVGYHPSQPQLSETVRNAFSNADEFLATAMEHGEFQELLKMHRPTVMSRARVRAMNAGRSNPTWWDIFVSAVTKAVMTFAPGRASTEYMDQLLSVYGKAAISSEEQAKLRVASQEFDSTDSFHDYPLDLKAFRDMATRAMKSSWGQAIHKALPTEELRKSVADEHFEGSMVNPTTDLFDLHQKHARLVTDMMEDGDLADDAIVAWVNEDRDVREPQITEGFRILTESVVDDVDVTKDIAANKWIWDDAAHPRRSGRPRRRPTARHRRDAFKRAAHAAGRAEWLALPTEVRQLLSNRAAIMSKQMEKFERKFTENWVQMLVNQTHDPLILPGLMTEAQAVREILDGKISKALKTALGENYQTIKGMGRMTRKGRLYVPLFRAGKYFISGRRDIPLPTVSRGSVSVDSALLSGSDRFEFVFTDPLDMQDYLDDIANSGDERPTGNPRRELTMGPAGKMVPTGNWRVPMQHRFMSMSDDIKELQAEKEALLASGDVIHMSDPLQLDQKASLSGAMPLKLEKMLNNINSMAGRSAAEKAVMRSMASTMFAQTQQGNRITKRLLKRSGVRGYKTDYDSMRTSFRTNNEMMSRHIVALDRVPAIAAARTYMRNYTDALSRLGAPGALDKLTPADQTRISRNMGKFAGTAERLRADVKVIEDRIEKMMEPGPDKLIPEDVTRGFLTLTTLSFLAGPSYSALQMASLPMFTFPKFVGEMARKGGWGSAGTRAVKYLYEAGTEVSFLGNYYAGTVETLMEGGEFAKGFIPRANWLKHSRTIRKSPNHLQDLYANMRANGVANVEEKIAMLEEMRLLGHIGQAGINQSNLHEDLLAGGVKNKVLRGISALGRIFSAFQEAAEINNRAVPAIAYFNHFINEGMTVAQASKMAINNTVSEQVGYAKENWPAIVSRNAGLTAAFMFKKFAAQQAINIYGSMLRATALTEDNKETRRAAQAHLATSFIAMTLLGGVVGYPLWEVARMLNYLLAAFGLNFMSTDWNEAKTNGEKMLANVVGERGAEDIVYGATRELGIDLSGRVAMDSLLFFKQPEEMTKEGWGEVILNTMMGAPGSVGMDAISGFRGMTAKVMGEASDTSWAKDISKLPIPKMLKDMLKAADLMENGPTTTTGIKTGKPAGIGTAVVQSLGFRTREQSRPFEQGSAAQHRIEQNVKAERQTLMTSIMNNGVSGDNARLLRSWNRSHPERDQRISMKNLSEARKRRRKIELDIRRKNLEAM